MALLAEYQGMRFPALDGLSSGFEELKTRMIEFTLGFDDYLVKQREITLTDQTRFERAIGEQNGECRRQL